jgi:hypothetical protein
MQGAPRGATALACRGLRRTRSSSTAYLLGVRPRHDQRPADGPVRGAQLRRHGQAPQRVELRGLPGGGQPQLVLGREDLELVLARRAAPPAQGPHAAQASRVRAGAGPRLQDDGECALAVEARVGQRAGQLLLARAAVPLEALPRAGQLKVGGDARRRLPGRRRRGPQGAPDEAQVSSGIRPR